MLKVTASKRSATVSGRSEQFYRLIPQPSMNDVVNTMSDLGKFIGRDFENVLSFSTEYVR